MSVTARDDGAGVFDVDLGSVHVTVGPWDRPDRPRATDLLLASLAVCTAGTIRAFAESADMPGFAGVDVTADAVSASRPQRLGTIKLTVVLRGDLDDRQVDQLTRAGARCKIHHTLQSAPTVSLDVSRVMK